MFLLFFHIEASDWIVLWVLMNL